ncbi:MAG TPA: hypothetical protein VI197_29580 [Polyangiaceae bacterium]
MSSGCARVLASALSVLPNPAGRAVDSSSLVLPSARRRWRLGLFLRELPWDGAWSEGTSHTLTAACDCRSSPFAVATGHS